MGYKVEDIANKILLKATDEEGGNLICNMKLQKMLYYMQGFYLAYFDKPFFDEEIKAWVYGPVVPSIYRKYKNYDNKGICYTGKVIALKSETEESLFDEVYDVYNDYSPIGLMRKTHTEDPWNSVNSLGDEIKKDIIKSFFKKKLKRANGDEK